MSNPKTARTRRQPPVRTIFGERVRLRPLQDQLIAARAALSGKPFNHEWALLIRAGLGI